jgi:hypothetical protein
MYQHLKFARVVHDTERHRKRGRQPEPPPDPKAFGELLQRKFVDAKSEIAKDIEGFDSRRLVKIVLAPGHAMPELERFGVQIVSQEDKTVVLAFASEEGLREFERRLATLAQTGAVERKDILFAIQDFDRWRPEDRTGPALGREGLPVTEVVVLDVELWPSESRDKRERCLESFKDWAKGLDVETLDTVLQPSLVMARVRAPHSKVDFLLNHRDVRTVDLPPRVGVTVATIQTDVNVFPEVKSPPADAPAVVVLDSGLTTGHPLIGPAVGDAQEFIPSNPNSSPSGHGTLTAGVALYGDVEACIRSKQFVPELRLFSGKVFADDGSDQAEFVEKAVEKSVRHFSEEYGCRVFNLSYGDLNKVYDGRRVRGLAYTLDRLARELNVLFVVPTGNLPENLLPENPLREYPEYLFSEDARLLDPAPALNVLTVGGIAAKEATRSAQRYFNRIEDIPVAKISEPSPFTRTGFSVGDAIKPDFVEEAGNWAMNPRAQGRPKIQGLGVVSFASEPLQGAFKEAVGTSFAAPALAHKAAKLAGRFRELSVDAIRALLAVHARWPEGTRMRFNEGDTRENRDKILRVVGYGKVEDDALYESTDGVVTLFTEDSIEKDRHHFYELPIPDDFWSPGRRNREIGVALAYRPEVRTTRLDYRRSKLSFAFVTEASLEAVTRAFQSNRAKTEVISERGTNRLISSESRNPATLQLSRWTFKTPLKDQKCFVVVTRRDANWSDDATDELERYALAIVIRDPQKDSSVNLYERIQTILQMRNRESERIRIRG